MPDSIAIDMLGLRIAFDQQFQHGALIQPAFPLADEAGSPAFDGEHVSAKPEQHNDVS